jgi:hypothetical protein
VLCVLGLTMNATTCTCKVLGVYSVNDAGQGAAIHGVEAKAAYNDIDSFW